MRDRFFRLVVAAGLLLCVGLAADAADFDQAGYETAISTIRCDCGCHPQSVKDCACGRAAEMREEIRALVVGGMTGEQIIAQYVAKHGEQIRIAPTARGFNLVAWLGPLVGLVAAGLGLFFVLRHWQRRRSEVPLPATAPPLGAEDPYMDRLRRELEEME